MADELFTCFDVEVFARYTLSKESERLLDVCQLLHEISGQYDVDDICDRLLNGGVI